MRRIERESRGEMRPGQDLVVAGYAGLAGTRKIIEKKEEELRTRYAKSYLGGEYNDGGVPGIEYKSPLEVDNCGKLERRLHV